MRRSTRRFGVFSIVLIGLLSLMLGRSGSAEAWRYFPVSAGIAPEAVITVDNQTKLAGSTIRLHGTGWTANEVVELRLAPTFKSVRANASGEWFKTIAVPNVSPRVIPLQGVGTRSKAVTDLRVTIIAPSTTTSTSTSTSTTIPSTTSTSIAPTTTSTTTAPTTTTSTTVVPSTQVTLGVSKFVTQLPGQQLWQAISWVGGSDIACNFQVTVPTDQGFGVYYSSGRAYSGPPESTDIAKGQSTYTAVKLRAPANATTATPLKVVATYTPCDSAGNAIASPVTLNNTVSIPVSASDVGLAQDTIEVGPYAAGTIGEANVYFTAYAPDVTKLQVRVTDTAGTEIYYPQGRDYTTPSKIEDIPVAESDYVGFRINLGSLTPGTKLLTLQVSYGGKVEKTTTLAVNVI